jgi:hypothetical protein
MTARLRNSRPCLALTPASSSAASIARALEMGCLGSARDQCILDRNGFRSYHIRALPARTCERGGGDHPGVPCGGGDREYEHDPNRDMAIPT